LVGNLKNLKNLSINPVTLKIYKYTYFKIIMNNSTRYFNYFITKINLGLKEGKEYKVNIVSILFSDFGYMFVTYLFLTLFSDLSSYFQNWSNFDKFTYIILIYAGMRFMRFFMLWRFSRSLKNGDLNSYLVRPLHPYFFASTTAINGAVVFTTIPVLILFFFIIGISSYENKLLSFLLHLFGTLYFVLILNVIQSLNFFMRDTFFYDFFFNQITPVTERFTPKAFEGNNFMESFIYLLPTSFYGYMVLELLNGDFIFLNYVYLGLSSFMLFLFLLILMWKLGLKRYEAFG
jgi:ABC-type uncharacterized transport system permease subunit